MLHTILAVNCGSSSLKFNLYEILPDRSVKGVINGIAEEIGNVERSTMKYVMGEEKIKFGIPFLSHEDAIGEMFSIFEKNHIRRETIVAIGHRVVHGGNTYRGSVMVNEKVIRYIEQLSPLAPLHNPQNLKGILITMRMLPGVPNVAVFDTAFHSTIPEHAYRYAVPEKWYQEYMVRRYGFHGTSHLYVSRMGAKVLGIPHDEFSCITAHLGNGSSITRIVNGKSMDTSMGFTPLEGVIMGTRSGNLDPAIIGYVADRMHKEGMELGEAYTNVNRMLNNESGLKAISGTSLMQDIRAKALIGDQHSEGIVDMYCYRIARYIGSYIALTHNCRAVIFTAGVGENEWYIRKKVLQMLRGMEFTVDDEINSIRGKIITFAKGKLNDTPIEAMVIPTNEELIIAYDTLFLGYLNESVPDVYPFET